MIDPKPVPPAMRLRLPRLRGLALVAALAGLGLGAWSVAATVAPSASEARVGERLSPFQLPAIPGAHFRGRFDARRYIGRKPMAIVFWATWCQPCKQQLPLYQQLHERYEDQGLVVVGISMDNANTITEAGPISRRLQLKFPIVSDLDSAVTSRLNSRRAAPYTVWVDHDGRIVMEQEGFTLAERDGIVRGIGQLVAAAQGD